MAREKVEFDVVGNDRGGSKAFRDVGDAAAKAGDKVDGLGKTAKDTGDKVDKSGDQAEEASKEYIGLAASIEVAQAEMRRLATEIDKTGNMDLAKDLRKQQSELRKLMNVKKLLGDDNDAVNEGARIGGQVAVGVASGISRAGSVISTAVGNAFGSVPPQAQVAIAGGLVVAATLAAPVVAGVLTGAVVGGIGTGAVAAGVTLAAKDPAVAAAGKELGATVSAGFKDAAKPFVPVTLDAIDTVRSEFLSLKPDIAGIFADASEYVEPLTRAGTGFVRAMVPGLREATANAAPFFDMLEQKLPQLGADIGGFFSKLSERSGEGADSFGQLIDATGSFIEFAGDATVAAMALGNALSTTWDFMEKYGSFDMMAPEPEKMFIRLQGAANQGADGVRNVRKETSELEAKAMAAAASVDALREAIDRGLNANLNARQAQRDLEAAIDDGAAALARNGQTAINHGAALDINSAKGRDNAAALDRIAQEAMGAYNAILETTGSQELANAASDRGRAKFIALARGMGLSKEAAAILADQLIKIKDRKVTVTANTALALAQALALQARINNMSARINVYAEPSGGFGGPAHSGMGNSPGIAEGGRIYGPGTGTSDDVVARVSNGEYVVRERAARAIGYDTLDALNQADRNPGALAVAASSGGSSSMSRPGGGEDLYGALVRALRTVPIVRLDDGRLADIYARTS